MVPKSSSLCAKNLGNPWHLVPLAVREASWKPLKIALKGWQPSLLDSYYCTIVMRVAGMACMARQLQRQQTRATGTQQGSLFKVWLGFSLIGFVNICMRSCSRHADPVRRNISSVRVRCCLALLVSLWVKACLNLGLINVPTKDKELSLAHPACALPTCWRVDSLLPSLPASKHLGQWVRQLAADPQTAWPDAPAQAQL